MLVRSSLDTNFKQFSANHWKATLRAVVSHSNQTVQKVRVTPHRADATSGHELIPLETNEHIHGPVPRRRNLNEHSHENLEQLVVSNEPAIHDLNADREKFRGAKDNAVRRTYKLNL